MKKTLILASICLASTVALSNDINETITQPQVNASNNLQGTGWRKTIDGCSYRLDYAPNDKPLLTQKHTKKNGYRTGTYHCMKENTRNHRLDAIPGVFFYKPANQTWKHTTCYGNTGNHCIVYYDKSTGMTAEEAQKTQTHLYCSTGWEKDTSRAKKAALRCKGFKQFCDSGKGCSRPTKQ